MSEPVENFEGLQSRECGEHRTVGPHRAWCHDCTEWCYPNGPCKGCEIVSLRAIAERAQVLATTDQPMWNIATTELHWIGRWLKYGDPPIP